MNKIKLFFGIVLFTLFVPSVNALNYDISTSLVNPSVNDKTLYEIKVSLINITDTDYGVAACSMNIDLSDGVKLNGSVRTLSSWSMLTGDVYLFDTGNPALKNTEFIVIPVKVSSNGTVTLSNISCSDGDGDVFVENKVINLEYISSSNNAQNGNNQNSNSQDNDNSQNNDNTQNNDNVQNSDNKDDEQQIDSNCDLSNIILSEGIIDFDPNITEYEIEVSNIDTLMVEPETASNRATYTVTKTEDSVVINVEAQDGSSKTYTIYVNRDVSVTDKNNKNNYVPIFIGIICVLVLINIFRIVRNTMKKG